MASDRAVFPRTSRDDWRRAAGRDPPAFVTDDGIAVPPIEPRRADAVPVDTRPGWRIVQRLTAADADAALREATSAIAGGASGIEIVFDPSAHPLASRLPVAGAKRLAAGLRDFGVPEVTFRIDAGRLTAEAAAPFAELAHGTGASLVLAYDPVAQFAASTDPGWPRLERGPDVDAAIAAGVRFGGAKVAAIADGRVWHAAGASDVQELAAVLATLVAFLRVADVRGGFGVALAADTLLFPTIAKFRAMRLLLLRLAEIIVAPADVAIHAETAWRTRTRIEPRMNVLRATIATVAAVAGSADSLTVLPFDDGDRDSQRLARNTQVIANAESHLARVADPGAGAGAIEALTGELAARAWASFQAIEAEGGIAAASVLERFTQAVAQARQNRSERVAKGELALVGVNAHVADDASFATVLADHPRSLLRYETLDAASIEMDEDQP